MRRQGDKGKEGDRGRQGGRQAAGRGRREEWSGSHDHMIT